MKLFKKFRPLLNYGIGLSVVFGLMLLANCGSDDDGGPTVEPRDQFIGSYNVVSATFKRDTVTIIIPIDATTTAPVQFPPESDATTIALAGLFDTAPTCADLNNTGVALQADGFTKLVCIGEDVPDEPQGAWSYDDVTKVITLSIGPPAAAIPLTVIIEDINLSGTNLTGTATNFPLPLDATMPLSATNAQFARIALVLLKRE